MPDWIAKNWFALIGWLGAAAVFIVTYLRGRDKLLADMREDFEKEAAALLDVRAQQIQSNTQRMTELEARVAALQSLYESATAMLSRANQENEDLRRRLDSYASRERTLNEKIGEQAKTIESLTQRLESLERSRTKAGDV